MLLAKILKSLSYRLGLLANKIEVLKEKQSVATPHELWVQDNGDKTLRLDYEISSRDIVLDVGGFEGQWASDIFSKYLCNIHIFEPIPYYINIINHRFEKNLHINLHKVALGKCNHTIEFSVAGDASSSHVLMGEKVKAKVVDFAVWFEERGIEEIALMKINIEGGEYDLLERMIETGIVSKIKNIQVQFHNFFPDAPQRMERIQKALMATHFLTYQYEFIWENWQLNTQDKS